jgi:gliding motility-associated-like protein
MLTVLSIKLHSQEITLFQQFNGRYDYLAIGNTLNSVENNLVNGYCETLASSSAELNIPQNTNLIAAYLYWAGSGSGDLEVNLNQNSITAEETYLVNYEHPTYNTLTYFSCFANVTNQIITEGNTNYELSNLDISDTITSNPGYCNTSTNFAGWCLYLIYEDDNLPLNQVNLFQGLEIINVNEQEKTILLENINVLDNENAKIGFLTWEGDSNLSIGETLSINNNYISNPPINPENNAFNGTNSFTNASDFFNIDLDVYSIENNIGIGDTQVEITLTTQADLIIINNIITVLNSQLPDASIQLNTTNSFCNDITLEIDYTVYNSNCTDILPASTPIAFFANNEFIGSTETVTSIPINASENGFILLEIPNTIPNNFNLTAYVDNNGNGIGNVTEISEINNSDEIAITITLPETEILNPITTCDLGYNSALFDLTTCLNQLNSSQFSSINYYTSLEDLYEEENRVININNYQSNTTPQTLFIRADDEICYTIFQFDLLTKNCPPIIPEGFSPNNDGINDYFNIQGLYTVFEKHELIIYNRYGTLIFKGDDTLKWNGIANLGINKGHKVPTGTYFYILKPNDTDFKPIIGWVYLNR